MTDLELFMEYLAALVFLCAGITKIVSYQCRPKTPEAANERLFLGMPFGSVAAVGLFEAIAAMTLLLPDGPWPQATIIAAAAVALASLRASIILYRLLRKQPVQIAVILFNLSLFVVTARLL